MKKSITIFIIILFCGSSIVVGQKISNIPLVSKELNVDRINSYRSGQSEIRDTIFPPIFLEECAETVFSFINPAGWGSIGGTNSFGDAEKAQRFEIEDARNIRVIEVGVFFAEALIVGDGNVQAKIYNVNNDTGGPGELLGTSNEIRSSDINIEESSVVVTTFSFDVAPVVEDREFFVGVDISQLYESNDTVSIFMSDIDCGDGSDSWELFADKTTWAAINDPDLSWQINTNFFMVAIVEYEETTSIDDQSNPLGLKVFPVPTSSQLNLQYQLSESSETLIDLYSIEGKKVLSVHKRNQQPGQHNETINTSALDPGSYYARIRTSQGITTARVLVHR